MHTLADYLAAPDPIAARAIERAIAAAYADAADADDAAAYAAAAAARHAEIARQHAHLIELF